MNQVSCSSGLVTNRTGTSASSEEEFDGAKVKARSTFKHIANSILLAGVGVPCRSGCQHLISNFISRSTE